MDLSPLLLTGAQLKKGRQLCGLDRAQLAEAADVSVATIQSIERRGSSPCRTRVATLLALLRVFESYGVSFATAGGISLTHPSQSNQPRNNP
jgi:transcriptional regulator with XRE-family HTH domain